MLKQEGKNINIKVKTTLFDAVYFNIFDYTSNLRTGKFIGKLIIWQFALS